MKVFDGQFRGRHYETGTIINVLDAMGLKAPHTGEGYSEALALGVSGGIAFGYFVFEYQGYLPHVALLTRNTFDPFERALDGLGVVRDVRTVTSAGRAEELLKLELDAGNPVVVWADVFSLSHTGLVGSNAMWAMLPMLVVGYEADGFWVVDSCESPVLVPFGEFSAARGRVKKDRFRFMVVERVAEEQLVSGVRNGLETCLALYLDKPPAGSAKNFGLSGMEQFSSMLTGERNKDSWARKFEAGPRFFQGVAGAVGQPGLFTWIENWGTSSGADRGTFALFLEEAAVVLEDDRLRECAEGFRESAGLWPGLAEACLPDDVEGLAGAKRLHLELEAARWAGDSDGRNRVIGELGALKDRVTESWPVDEDRRRGICGEMARRVDEIRAAEGAAVDRLGAVVRG